MPGAPFIHIREANQDDVPTLSRLWPARAELQLDGARAWIAEHRERVVACASAQPARLALGHLEHRLAELWVSQLDPAYRGQNIGPRLAAAMSEALATANTEALFQLRPSSAPAPAGFTLPCTRSYAVRAKVLRPFALLSKRGQWPRLAGRAAGPIDALAGLPLRAPGWRPRKLAPGSSLVELSLPEDAEAIAALRARSCLGRASLRLDAQAIAQRHRSDDTCLGLTRRGIIIAQVGYRVVRDPEGLCVAELLDLAARDDDPRLLALLLRGVERRLRGQPVELVRFLDGLGDELSKVASLAAYFRQAEGYTLALGALPSGAPLAPQLRASASRWRLGLL